jgi:two-component system, OmpR family, phosphate regulon response regulator PhoB
VSDAQRAHDGGEELVSRISHELRTPLAVIVGYGELLGTRNDDATRLAAADRILEAAGRLSKGIESTLTVLALDLIDVELVREPIGLDRLVADAIALAGPGASAVDTERVTVWPVVQADSERLTGTLATALCATAEAGRIELDVEQRDPNAALVISSGGEWTGTDGARLALYALGRVATRLGGSVTIRSSTDVSLELPLARQEAVPGRRVLVVDDDPGVRNLLRVTLLTFDGLEIVEASSAVEALACLEKETLDLILLDWRMPEGSGAEVLEELGRRGHDVPVIVVTAEGESGRQLAESLGADMFLTKPFSPIQLLHTVEQLLPGLGTA